jgi:hypothetical protein
MRCLALVGALLALGGCSAFQSSLAWPHDAGGGLPGGDGGASGPDAGAVLVPDSGAPPYDAGCPVCVLGSSHIGGCCLQ